MKKQVEITALKAPVVIDFNGAHPHKYFQKVLITWQRGERTESKEAFFSCTARGLNKTRINYVLLDQLGANESLEDIGDDTGFVWLDDHENAIRVQTVDFLGLPTQIHHISDPVLVM
jgi:hypothetical protein